MKRRLNLRINLHVLGMVAANLLVWGVAINALADESAGPDGPGLGDLVTYRDEAGGAWCAHVDAMIPNGPGGVPFAWITIDVDTRRAVRVPVSLLKAGCPL